MNEIDYKPNSHKFKEEQQKPKLEEKRVEKVVKGSVTIKKKSGVAKITESIISEDLPTVLSYIASEVVVPTFKELISNIITKGTDIALFGEAGRNRRSSTNAPYVSYNRFSERDRRDDRRSTNDYHSRSRLSYDSIVLESRGEAEEVLRRMDEILDRYQMVRVADLYDLVGVTGEHTDNKYGWTDLSTARVERQMGGGYKLRLPRALPIG